MYYDNKFDYNQTIEYSKNDHCNCSYSGYDSYNSDRPDFKKDRGPETYYIKAEIWRCPGYVDNRKDCEKEKHEEKKCERRHCCCPTFRHWCW